MKQQILILTHDNGRLATKFIGTMEKHEGVDIDVKEMKRIFERKNYECHICTFSELDLKQDYMGWFVIYASSEDYGKFYKEYIEDIVLCLSNKGAIVLPSYIYLRAHANKSLQEMLRCSFIDEELKKPIARSFGSYNEVEKAADSFEYPCVLKTSSGSGSSGVLLVANKEELLLKAKYLMKIHYVDFSRDLGTRLKLYLWRLIKIVINHKHRQQLSEKMYTNKIVVQEFIPGLEGDYKVLYFFNRYYVLHRMNRKDDFRASGSGKFHFPDMDDKTVSVLDYARKAASEINQPMISMDIVVDRSGKCHLIEYQCVYFGPLTMQFSKYYYAYCADSWKQMTNTSTLEDEYCRAISDYIATNYENRSR